MSFLSIFKLSLHSLGNNKLRTFLTILVLFILSSIVVLLGSFGMGFADASTNAGMEMLDEQGVMPSVEIKEITEIQQGMGFSFPQYSYNMRPDDYNEVVRYFEEENTYFDSITFTADTYVQIGNSSMKLTPTYFKANPYVGKVDYLVSGRMWDASDEESNNLWLSSTFVQDFTVGENVSISGFASTFTVCGFINKDAIGGWDSNVAFVDYKHFESTYSNSNNMSGISSVSLIKAMPQGSIPDDTYVKALEDVIDNFDQTDGGKAVGLQWSSDLIDQLSMIVLMKNIIIITIVVVAVLLILFSIGSVAGTIKITVEQNRKFFGMMKAIGMQDATVSKIVRLQAIIMTFVAVAFSALLSFIMLSQLGGLVDTIITGLFGSASNAVISMPVYIPIMVFLLLSGFIVLFTKKDLAAFNKLDVISVISEVD